MKPNGGGARAAPWLPPSTPNWGSFDASGCLPGFRRRQLRFRLDLAGQEGRRFVDIVNMGAAGTPLTTGDKACSASTSGNTPTTSTTATCVRSAPKGQPGSPGFRSPCPEKQRQNRGFAPASEQAQTCHRGQFAGRPEAPRFTRRPSAVATCSLIRTETDLAVVSPLTCIGTPGRMTRGRHGMGSTKDITLAGSWRKKPSTGSAF